MRGSRGDGLTVEIRNRWPPDVTGTTSISGAGSLDVTGTAPIPGAGSGIIGLAERVGLAGGWLEHGSTPGGDFRLWAWLPWPA